MPAFTKQNRRYNKNPQRRKIPGVGAEATRPRRTPIIPTIPPRATSAVVIVTFNVPVIVKGLPGWTGPTAQHVISVVQNSPTQLTLTFSASIITETLITIPFEDPAIRHMAGGFVQPGQYESPDVP